MTCIVGIVDKEKVYIGADSAGTGNFKRTIRKDLKVFVRDKFIMGFTSSFRMGQLLMHDDRFSMRCQKSGEDDFHYLINAFIPAIQKLFSDGGYLTKDKEELVGGVFLLGFNKRLYRIDCDFQVGESVANYEAVGCGDEFALGSLFTTEHSEESAEQRIIKALEAASNFSIGVAPPFNILSL